MISYPMPAFMEVEVSTNLTYFLSFDSENAFNSLKNIPICA